MLLLTAMVIVPQEGKRGVTWANLIEHVPLASQNPYPIIVYCSANNKPHLSHFW